MPQINTVMNYVKEKVADIFSRLKKLKFAPSSRSIADFFGKLSRGELGLTITFWLFGVLPTVLLFFLIQALPNKLLRFMTKSSIEAKIVLLLLLPLFFGFLWYWVLWIIGSWRAAGRYQGPIIWPVLIKFYLLLAIILGIFLLLAGSVDAFKLFR